MGRTLLALSALVAGLAAGGLALADDMKARFADSEWNGRKVPKAQVCSRFGGAGATPALKIEGVPADADALIVSFSDESFPPMDGGGHGVIGFEIGAERPVVLPSVPGETDSLPAGVWMVEANKAPGIAPGAAYLPPCSGGMGNTYSARIKAVSRAQGDDAALAETRIKLGKY